MCSLTIECVLLRAGLAGGLVTASMSLSNVFFYYRMCSLTTEYVLLPAGLAGGLVTASMSSQSNVTVSLVWDFKDGKMVSFSLSPPSLLSLCLSLSRALSRSLVLSLARALSLSLARSFSLFRSHSLSLSRELSVTGV